MILTYPAECPPVLGGARASGGLFGAALAKPALMCFGWGGRLGFMFKMYDHETTRESGFQAWCSALQYDWSVLTLGALYKVWLEYLAH